MSMFFEPKQSQVFTLTRQEKILILCLMASLLLGATVKHWRALYRVNPAEEKAKAP